MWCRHKAKNMPHAWRASCGNGPRRLKAAAAWRLPFGSDNPLQAIVSSTEFAGACTLISNSQQTTRTYGGVGQKYETG
jgi:hypothetical protein